MRRQRRRRNASHSPYTMILLPHSLQAIGAPDAKVRIKAELEQLSADLLPLQQAMAYSSYVSEEPFSVMVIDITEEPDSVLVTAGVFYRGIVAGCSCADDPTPIESQQEYCELLLRIDRATAETTVSLRPQ